MILCFARIICSGSLANRKSLFWRRGHTPVESGLKKRFHRGDGTRSGLKPAIVFSLFAALSASSHTAAMRLAMSDAQRMAWRKRYVATRSNEYPIPTTLDLSTNALRQLVFCAIRARPLDRRQARPQRWRVVPTGGKSEISKTWPFSAESRTMYLSLMMSGMAVSATDYEIYLQHDVEDVLTRDR